MRGDRMSGEDEGRNEGVSRRRFVQVCVGVATVAAVGSTVSSFLGLRSPLEVEPPPDAVEAVAVCSVCSVGCGLRSVSSKGEAFPPRGDTQSIATSGMVCGRGALPPSTVWPSTLATPLKRISPTSKGTTPSMDQFQTITWDEAIRDVVGALVDAGLAFGADARGCILGTDVALEDAYVASKLFKGVLGTPHLDCVSSMHQRAGERVQVDQFGQLAPPTCYADTTLANMFLVMGEDIAVTHPVLYAMVAGAVQSKGATLVVADPRRTATSSRTKAVHVPVSAGGEVVLLNAVGHVLVHEMEVAPAVGARDMALNVDAFAEYLKLYDPDHNPNMRVDPGHVKDLCDGPSEWVGQLGNRDANGFLKSFDVPSITGLDAETIRDLARSWNLARNVMTIWSSRLSGSGDDGAAVSTVVNLHLLTAQMGRPGAGPLAMHAQAGGRGSMEAGATPLTLPGGAPGGTGEAPAALVETWGSSLADEAARLPEGLGALETLARAKAGDLPVLLLLGGSVSTQIPDLDNLVDPALRRSMVVVTAAHLDDPDVAYADYVLPRPSWYERECYAVSSERRVGRSLPSMAALEGVRTELDVLSSMGRMLISDPHFEFPTSTQAMEEMRRATRRTPADLTALPLGRDLTESRGVQWPVPDERTADLKGTARRYLGQDGINQGFPTPSGKATIMPREWPGLRRSESPVFPLTAVMSLDGATWWDGRMYLPQGGDVLRPSEVEGAYVELTAEDAAELLLLEGSTARVTSAQGSAELPVRISEKGTAKGTVFLPWGVDIPTQRLAPSGPLDSNGVPPWSAFPVRVEPL